MKFHIAAALLVMAVGVYVELTATDWCLVILAIGLVLSAELLNSSIEGLVDLLEPRHHPIAGKVKDMAAGGVLVASVVAGVIGVVVFIKYLPG